MALQSDILNQCYIHNIRTQGLRNIKDSDIELGKPEDKPVHLLITGDNGVGKTTFVRELYNTLNCREGGKPLSMFLHHAKNANLAKTRDLCAADEFNAGMLYKRIKDFCAAMHVIPDCAENWDYYAAVADGDFLIFKFGARRKEDFITPDGPKKIADKEHGEMFIQMLVNLKTQSAFANQRHDIEEEERIEKWFSQFDDALAKLLGHKDFKLEFLIKDFNFEIREKGKEPYSFTQLSDGYSAIIAIISEIMLGMSTDPLLAYDMPGIVIIDEIETHLHVELQKKILPFLINLFPNIQFVVTTHSPFVLSSIENAVIYDLGSHKRFEDFSNFSYSNIIEGFYNESNYSNVVIRKLEEMGKILSKEKLSEEDKNEITAFDKEFDSLPSFQPLELKNKWLTMKLNNIKKLI